MYQALLARGAADERPPQLTAKMPDHDLWIGFVRDPDGNLIGLMEANPVAPAPRRPRQVNLDLVGLASGGRLQYAPNANGREVEPYCGVRPNPLIREKQATRPTQQGKLVWTGDKRVIRRARCPLHC